MVLKGSGDNKRLASFELQELQISPKERKKRKERVFWELLAVHSGHQGLPGTLGATRDSWVPFKGKPGKGARGIPFKSRL